MTDYYYIPGKDGVDRTFDIYADDKYIVSTHYWDMEAEAEAEAQRIVKVLKAHAPQCAACRLKLRFRSLKKRWTLALIRAIVGGMEDIR